MQTKKNNATLSIVYRKISLYIYVGTCNFFRLNIDFILNFMFQMLKLSVFNVRISNLYSTEEITLYS